MKPLVGGSRAVALLNRGSSAMRIATSAGAIGLPSARATRCATSGRTRTSSTGGSISAEVPGDSTVLLRVSPR